MAEQIRITLPDGSVRSEPAGATARDLAESIGPRLARAAVAARVDGEIWDLHRPLPDGATVEILTDGDSAALEVLRHSAAHVLATAVRQLFPEAHIGFGPAIEDGFYYDFEVPRPFTPDDLAAIEQKMRDVVKADHPFRREEVTLEAGRERFRDDPLKLERLDEFDEGETISVYSDGPFVDLCRGPHLPTTGRLKHFKLLHAAGAYWRGDSRRQMLQRIYGTAFGSKKELDEYFARLEELKRRDHRRLGRELDLFSFHPEAPASPFFHPRGALVYNALIELMREKYVNYGYEEVITPQIFDVELWKRSGHYENYRDDMFFADAFEQVEERSSSVKPMNCPSHCVLFGSKAHSYRDLPRRIADFGRLHRYERSGVVTGLTRVRTFSQDDAHIFCTPEQIEPEITALFDFIFEIYDLFGFEDVSVYLSTRPEKAMGDPEVWKHAEAVLARCLEEREDLSFTVKHGEGAFYGPKIDFDVLDALGRSWQLATIQLDFQMPERFELSYVDSDGTDKQPVMIHRAILGSLERFYGVMLEHFGGDLPPWLAPEQARVLPITDAVNDYAEKVVTELAGRGLRAEIDRRSEKLGYKIRDGETMKVPYLLVVGQREAEDGTVALRLRHRRDEGVQPLDEVADRIERAVRTRSLKL